MRTTSKYTSSYTSTRLYYFQLYLIGCGRNPSPSIILDPIQITIVIQLLEKGKKSRNSFFMF
jgi:hypothetical protein